MLTRTEYLPNTLDPTPWCRILRFSDGVGFSDGFVGQFLTFIPRCRILGFPDGVEFSDGVPVTG